MRDYYVRVGDMRQKKPIALLTDAEFVRIWENNEEFHHEAGVSTDAVRERLYLESFIRTEYGRRAAA